MRGSKAKAIRKYVREKFPFLSAKPLYELNEMSGNTVLAQQCQRHVSQRIKTSYKRARSNSSQSWRRYNDGRTRSN